MGQSHVEKVGFQYPALYQRQFSNHSPLDSKGLKSRALPRLSAETCVLALAPKWAKRCGSHGVCLPEDSQAASDQYTIQRAAPIEARLRLHL